MICISVVCLEVGKLYFVFLPVKMSTSAYYLSLTGDIKQRYDKKITVIGNIDPYSLLPNELCFPVVNLPNVTTIDITDYLIYTHSFYTRQQLKAHKSLQAFKLYEAGAVLQIQAKQMTPESFVILSKVRRHEFSV